MLRALVVSLLLVSLPSAAKPPRLTLFIVVDSLSSDLLLRSRPQLRSGLKSVLDGGAFFPYARYEYAEPLTAPGHTTLATGANPWRHGIVANRTLNRQTGKQERPFADAAHPALEAPLGADDVSPENILVETMADRLRVATQGRGKAIAISDKARAAIPLAGRLGQGYWFSEAVGKFVTGTYYAKEFPAWVRAFNEKKLPETYFGKEWTLLAPARNYTGDDDRPFEGAPLGLGRTFPHPITGGLSAPGLPFYTALSTTPLAGDVIVALAKAALEGESLGKDEVPDLLAVSFSQTDLILHQYGPFSWEAQDAILRLDRQIGDLVGAVEKAAGRGNFTVVIAADHGGDATPEELAAAGLPAARVPLAPLKAALAKELAAKFRGANDLVWGFEAEALYLNYRAIAEKQLDAGAVRRAAAQFLRTQPGILVAATRDDIQGGADLNGFGTALRMGFHPDRSADVWILPKPHHALTDDATGAAHYSPFAYDQQTPVVFSGRGIRKGIYRQEIHPVDVAPTLCALWEIGPPATAEGEVRFEALEGR